MRSLFTDYEDARGAAFSADRRYRYILTRGANPCADGVVNFVLLNPSTADAERDDPTVRRCQGYARRWGYGDLIVTNLFAYRSVDSKALWCEELRQPHGCDPVGNPENDAAILEAARRSSLVVCGWGGLGSLRGRGRAVLAMLTAAGCRPHCLKLLLGCQPGHPLYLPGDLEPIPWEAAGPGGEG